MKFKRLFCAVSVVLLLFTSPAFAQQKQVTGKVVDSSGAGIGSVSVIVKGSKTGAQTNSTGAFSINAPSNATTLVISSVGFETQEVPISSNPINVSLKSSNNTLNDVTVVSVGYGTLDKKEVSSAITHVDASALSRVSSNSALMSLQGKVAGLTVTNTSAADPNSTPSIQLRGVSSRNAGLGPLYVINGIPGGNIDNINQNDILSIDVLKSGAASAIYGTRGSNGVIIITTKKGTSQPQAFYEGYGALDYITNKLHVLPAPDFLAHNRGVDFGGNTNWLDAVSNNPSFTQKHTLQFSGGSSKTNYFASVDYRDADGIDLRASKKEYGARINLNHTSNNNLYTVTLNIAPRYAKTNTADYSAFNYGLTLNPTIPVYDSAGKYNYITTGFFSNNPVENAKLVLAQQEIKELDISGSFTLNILRNLNTTATVGEVSRSLKTLNFTSSNVTYVVHGNGRSTASQKQEDNDQKSFEWVGNYNASLQKHSFKLIGGYSYQYFTYEEFDANNQQFPSNVLTYNNLGSGLYNLEDGVNGVGSFKNSSKLIAFFGRVSYDFDQKYYLTASVRREGSSKFGIDNKWGNFPAVSAAWRLDQEAFLKGVSWINNLKLRADYGETGNQDFDNYLSLLLYSGYGYYPFNGTSYQVYGPSQNLNPNLHWEKALNFNMGLDFDLFQSRISGSLNYYIRKNQDLLGSYPVPIPPNIQTNTYLNVGTMKNSGFEIQLTASAVKSKNFSYDVSFTGATNHNNFVSFSNSNYQGGTFLDVLGMPAPGSPGNLQRLQEGMRIGSFYTYKSAGVDSSGALQVYNKDGKVIAATQASNDDKRFVGNGLPKFTASLGNTFRYKNWDLGIFLRGAFGYKLFNTYAFYLGTPATQADANTLTLAYDGSKYSKLTNPSTTGTLSDYFLEPGGFVKIDNAMLGYTQPLSLKYIKSVRIYVSARNLHTFTKFKGGDPDLVQTNGLYPGVIQDGNGAGTLNYYPSTTSVLFGIQLNF